MAAAHGSGRCNLPGDHRGRADGERQIGAGAGAGAAAGRRGHQCRLDADLPRAARADGAADAGGRGGGAASCSTACAPAAEPGSAAWWRGPRWRRWRRRGGRAGADPVRRHRHVFQRADRTAWPKSPSRAPAARAEARRAAGGHRPGGAACPAGRRPIRPPPPGCAHPTASAWPAPGRFGAAPAGPGRLAGGASLPPAPWRFAAILLDPPRDALRSAIDARFAAMLEAGARRGSAGAAGARPGPGPAGDARAWRARTWRVSARRAARWPRRRERAARRRAIHQAAGDVVPPPHSGTDRAHANDFLARFAI